MCRLGLLLVIAGLTAGCSSSGRIVVQDGYRGITPTPIPTDSDLPPGALTLAPEAKADENRLTTRVSITP